MKYDARTLLFPNHLEAGKPGLTNRVTPVEADWDWISVETRRLAEGQLWEGNTGECEVAIVLLGGRCDVKSSRKEWGEIGRRKNVFDGMPWAVYLPRFTSFAVGAIEDVELAYCWVPTSEDHDPQLITPQDSSIEIRGGDNNSRQINSILPPGFPSQRLTCVEVYTPGGNWSSYPPHKHDEHRTNDADEIVEADLEEVYIYKFDRPEGWAMQRIYTADRKIDAAVVARDGDIVLVPEGYHPVSTAPGHSCYYLNFLAGSAQSLASTDDPEHAWVKDVWGDPDPRVPMVNHDKEGSRAR